MKKPFFSLCICCLAGTVYAQQFSLLKDINPGSASSNSCYLTSVGNGLFFAANDGANGMELWKSDGTTAGTMLVKDIFPGISSSSIGYLTAVGHTLFFVANNGTNGMELWKSDGSAAGTGMVKDIRTGSLGSYPSGLVAVNSTLFFAADNGVSGTELWKSDGTEAGTVLVKDINSLSASSYPQSMANMNGTLFFAATNGSSGVELWKSDGTAAGTMLVKDIWSGSNDSYPTELVNVSGTLFFAANNGTKGVELWKSDGTAAGTLLVKDIRSGSSASNPTDLRNVNGRLFFSADNGTTGSELWKSDGTATGTVLIRDVWPGTGSGAAGNFSKLVNQLIFTGNDGVTGYKTWQSDGSSAGTKIASAIADPGSGRLQELTETNTNIYASITETDLGLELWVQSFSSVLPLTWLDFTANVAGKNAMLSWSTANEINADNFKVERSSDGQHYESVATVPATNKPGNNIYQFTDRDVVSKGWSKVYYRIKQNDRYGRYTYSKIVALPLRNESIASLYPNPASGWIHVNLAISGAEFEYRIYDKTGRVVIDKKQPATPGAVGLSVDVSRLAAGTYYLILPNQQPLPFVKQR